MVSYYLTIKPSARKEWDRYNDALFSRIELEILSLATNPRPPGCKKLHDSEYLWRIRVGDYRIVYTIDDKSKIVDINRIAHRSQVYD